MYNIAILSVRDFQDGDYKDFYRQTFKLIESLETEYLIIDLRDNHGGELPDAMDLFTYFSDSSFTFIDNPVLASENSLYHERYFIEDAGIVNVLLAILYPATMITRSIFIAMIEEKDGYLYLPLAEADTKKVSPYNFDGKVYVMINGGTFSASCLLSSNLRSMDNVMFVGEETGGAQNGTVAGKMARLILPSSKLRLLCGLMTIKPTHQGGEHGRGIMPDIEIKPDLQDHRHGIDPELEWILLDIEKSRTGR